MFVEKVNHVTGEREWEVADDDYDMAQELARSRFADMILDYDRNDKYLAGLKTIINDKKGRGERVHVLDIGTGTGLLSLMAAREGADQVTSLEVFQPMAECATKITQASPWKDIITVISTRSTDLSHLGEKPNVIVAEVFDTELNGEGALRTFKEALINLVQPGCRVIPSTGRVWAVPVSSEFLRSFNRIPTLDNEQRGTDNRPLNDCPGTSAVFDAQLSRVREDQFTKLADPLLAFQFDFESPDDIIYDEVFDRVAVCTSSGQVDAILMWWDLDMDRTGVNFIDMAPTWANKEYEWRDHWMQAVYYLPSRVELTAGEKFSLRCSHDEFSMWFSIGTSPIPRPYCDCGLHSLLARQSVFRLNQLVENTQLQNEIEKLCSRKSVVCLGEGSLIGLIVGRFAKSTVIVESNSHFRRILQRYVDYYGFVNLQIVEDLKTLETKPDVIVGEPFYLSAMNPWQNLRFWHDANRLRSRFGKDIQIYPQSGTLFGVCERFEHLHKIAAPVGVVNGFDLSMFDEISQKAREATDAVVDEQPLWEYGGRTTGLKFPIRSFDMGAEPVTETSDVKIRVPSCTNGIPMWMEWSFGELTLTTGMVGSASIDGEPCWSEGWKQGVYLIPPPLLEKPLLHLQTIYDSLNGDIVFKFK